jgi:hypothetical protein
MRSYLMSLKMRLHIAALRKSLPTKSALVGLFPRVTSHVDLESA